jgi:TonB family protein
MMLSKVTPVYPMKARILGVQGSVIMHAIISKTGTIEDLKVISGPELLQQAAVDAVQRWTYRPYILDCKPVEVETSITVNFVFGGAKPEPPPPPPLEALLQSSVIDMQHDSPTPVVPSHAPAESSDAGTGAKEVGGMVSQPVLVKRVVPQFSPEAKQRKLQGVVFVSIIVDEHGRPQNVHVTRGVGHGLDENAVEAVKQYRFKPAMKDGKPVAVFLNVEVNFEVF